MRGVCTVQCRTSDIPCFAANITKLLSINTYLQIRSMVGISNTMENYKEPVVLGTNAMNMLSTPTHITSF